MKYYSNELLYGISSIGNECLHLRLSKLMWWSSVAYAGTAMVSWMVFCSLGSIVLFDPLASWSLLIYPFGLLYMGVAFVVARLNSETDVYDDTPVVPLSHRMICAIVDSFSFYICPILVGVFIRMVYSLVEML